MSENIPAQLACKNCVFCDPSVGPYLVCRRSPPVTMMVHSNKDEKPYVMTRFPVVKPEDWCGEFKT